jgi:hypothetical protein
MTHPILDSPDKGLQSRFALLARQWKEETALLSSTTEMIAHPAYQAIIGLGMPVVPLILQDLAREKAHWFEALKAITNDDPVPPEHHGRISAMAEDWLEWRRDLRPG